MISGNPVLRRIYSVEPEVCATWRGAPPNFVCVSPFHHPSRRLIIMPREALAKLSLNIRRPKRELSPAACGRIIGHAEAGEPAAKIARVFKVPRRIVYDTIRKASYRPH
mgnify:CR=1 FL=1